MIRLSNNKFSYLKIDSKYRNLFREFTDIEMQLVKENDRDIYWRMVQSKVKSLENCKFIEIFIHCILLLYFIISN